MPLWNALVRINELEGIRAGIQRSAGDFVKLLNQLGTGIERGASVGVLKPDG